MKLSDQAIEEFQVKYHEHCGQEITRQQAAEYGAKVLRLMHLIYRPMRKRDMNAVQREVKELKLKHYGKPQ